MPKIEELESSNGGFVNNVRCVQIDFIHRAAWCSDLEMVALECIHPDHEETQHQQNHVFRAVQFSPDGKLHLGVYFTGHFRLLEMVLSINGIVVDTRYFENGDAPSSAYVNHRFKESLLRQAGTYDSSRGHHHNHFVPDEVEIQLYIVCDSTGSYVSPSSRAATYTGNELEYLSGSTLVSSAPTTATARAISSSQYNQILGRISRDHTKHLWGTMTFSCWNECMNFYSL
jgi:hypothetical protein